MIIPPDTRLQFLNMDTKMYVAGGKVLLQQLGADAIIRTIFYDHAILFAGSIGPFTDNAARELVMTLAIH